MITIHRNLLSREFVPSVIKVMIHLVNKEYGSIRQDMNAAIKCFTVKEL